MADTFLKFEPDATRPAPLAGHVALCVLLSGMMTASLTGVLGGGAYVERAFETAAARLSVEAPGTLRTGEFFEFRIAIDAAAPIAAPSISVAEAIVRDVTVNSLIPAPESERSDGAAFAFEYPPLGAGERLNVKIDGQVNDVKFGALKGPIVLRDGDLEIARIDMDIKVLP